MASDWVGLTEDEENALWASTVSDWELMKRTEEFLRKKNAGKPAADKAGVDEPVAWMREGWGPDCGPYVEFYRDDEMGWRDRKEWTPLFTRPQPQADVPKTNFCNMKGDKE